MSNDYKSAVARSGGDKLFDKSRIAESVCYLKSGDSDGTPPLLTIGIPVFNGEQSIEKTLNGIYNSLQFLSDPHNVEIVICDNASTDRTSDAIHRFFNEKSVQGSYFRHEINLGFDSNLDSIVKFSNGQYVWFFACGDEVKPDAVGRLVEKLEHLSVSNLLLDFDRFGEADFTLIQIREHDIKSDLIIEGRNNFIYPRYAPAISANVINREKWIACLDEKFTASGWGHIERILKILSLAEKSETAILAGPFFTLFVDKHGWWTKPDGYKLHLEHLKVIQKMNYFGFSLNAARSRLKELNGIVLVRSVIGARKYGYRFSRNDLNEIREYCGWGVYPLILVGLHIPLRLASFIFSESQRKALRLGFRKIYQRIFSGK